MRSPQKRISDYEREIRKRQPMIEKMIMRSRSILSECEKLKPEEKLIIAARMHEMGDLLSKRS